MRERPEETASDGGTMSEMIALPSDNVAEADASGEGMRSSQYNAIECHLNSYFGQETLCQRVF